MEGNPDLNTHWVLRGHVLDLVSVSLTASSATFLSYPVWWTYQPFIKFVAADILHFVDSATTYILAKTRTGQITILQCNRHR